MGGPGISRYVMLEVHYNNPDKVRGTCLRALISFVRQDTCEMSFRVDLSVKAASTTRVVYPYLSLATNAPRTILWGNFIKV